MTGIESLAAILALIGQFQSERGAKETASYEEFMAWLVQKNHSELTKLLELNTKATIGIKAILNQGREQVLERLERIDQVLASISANYDGFRELALGINPASLLSAQAVDILSQFCSTNASRALEIGTDDGIEYIFLDGTGNSLTIREPQFVESDFSTLVENRFLLQEVNGRGQKIFVFTRLGASVVRADGS